MDADLDPLADGLKRQLLLAGLPEFDRSRMRSLIEVIEALPAEQAGPILSALDELIALYGERAVALDNLADRLGMQANRAEELLTHNQGLEARLSESDVQLETLRQRVAALMRGRPSDS